MANTVDILGIRTNKMGDEERREYAMSAQVADDDINEVEFIKVHIDPNYKQGTEIKINSFQQFIVNVRSTGGGGKRATIKTSKDYDGKPVGVGVEFKPDKFGVLRAFIPDTPFNRDILTKMSIYANEIIVDDKDVKKAIQTEAKKRREAFDKFQIAAEALATYEVERENAPTLKSMRKMFGEVLDGIKEYDESFGEQITKRSREYFIEFKVAGKVLRTPPKPRASRSSKDSGDTAKETE